MIFPIKKTKHYWDKLASKESKKDFAKRSWGGINKIGLNYNYLVTGDRNYYWIDYMRDKYFTRDNAGHVLSLGCGEGFIERLFKLKGFHFDSITGVDISSVCTKAARKLGKEADLAPEITYVAADLNTYVPKKKPIILFFSFTPCTIL